MKFSLIICVDKEWGFAKNSQIPWSIPKENEHFIKTVTKVELGNTNAYLVGKKSWEMETPEQRSFLLKNCHVLVLSRTGKMSIPKNEQGYVCSSFDRALQKLALQSYEINNVFICGGFEIYIESLKRGLITDCIISKIDNTFGCDLHIRSLNEYLKSNFTIKETIFNETFKVEYWRNSGTNILQNFKRTCTFEVHGIKLDVFVSDLRVCEEYPMFECSLTRCLKFLLEQSFYFRKKNHIVYELIENSALTISLFLRYFYAYARVVVKINYMGISIVCDDSLQKLVRKEVKDWGEVDVLMEAKDWNFVILKIFPKTFLPEHYHTEMKESEITLDNGISGWQESGIPHAIKAGTKFLWKKEEKHGYFNTTSLQKRILSINDRIFSSKYEISTGYLPPNHYFYSLNKYEVKDKFCVIIGATGGIGSSWIQSALDSGYKVISVSKSTKNILVDQIFNFSVSCDLEDLDQIDRMCERLEGLNITRLVIASGIKQAKNIEFDNKLCEKTFSVNYVGPLYLVNKLLAKGLINDDNCRIIFISSSLHDPECIYREKDWCVDSIDDLIYNQLNPYYDPDIAYYKSKFALECFVAYAKKTFCTNATFISVNPGYFPKTRIFYKQNEAYVNKKIQEQPLLNLSSINEYNKWLLNSLDIKPSSYYNLQKQSGISSPEKIRSIKHFPHKENLWSATQDICLMTSRSDQKLFGRYNNCLELYSLNLCNLDHKDSDFVSKAHWLIKYFGYKCPDIICLQGVSKDILDNLETFCIDNGYFLLEKDSEILRLKNINYLSVTLTKWKSEKTKFISFSEENNISTLFKIADAYFINISLGKIAKNSSTLLLKKLECLKKHISENLIRYYPFVMCLDTSQITKQHYNALISFMQKEMRLHKVSEKLSQEAETGERKASCLIFSSNFGKKKSTYIKNFAYKEIFRLPTNETGHKEVFLSNYLGTKYNFLLS